MKLSADLRCRVVGGEVIVEPPEVCTEVNGGVA